MEIFKQRNQFIDLLRQKLTQQLRQSGYNLYFDNQIEDQSISKNWVFRLQYLGKNKIEIYNDDYRDYTEYFRLKVNDEEIFVLNLDKCKSVELAFDEVKEKLIDKI